MRIFDGFFITLMLVVMGLVLVACQSTAPATPEISLAPEEMGQLLFEAVKVDDVTEVKRLLEAGANANFASADGHVFILAAMKGNIEVVKLLEEHGGDMNAQDVFQKTPLIYAVINDHVAVVEMLLDWGADANTKDSGGYEAPLLCHAAGGNQVEMTELLIARGADLTLVGDTGYTPLHCAAYSNSREAAQVLIEAGAPLDLLNNGGQTPLDLAVHQGNDDIAEILRKAGAKE